jgi:hypothetical protein
MLDFKTKLRIFILAELRSFSPAKGGISLGESYNKPHLPNNMRSTPLALFSAYSCFNKKLSLDGEVYISALAGQVSTHLGLPLHSSHFIATLLIQWNEIALKGHA